MRRLTGQVAVIGIGRVLNMAASSATLMVLSRVMPNLEQYGALCQLMMLYMVFSQIFVAGLPQSIYYFMPRYQGGERRGFLTQTVAFMMLAGLFLGVGLYLSANVAGKLMNSHLLPSLLQVFAIYPFFMLPTLAIESTMLHHNRPVASVLFQAAVRVSMFCSLVVPSLMGFELRQVIWVWVGAAAVMWAISLVMILSTVRTLPFVWRPEMLREELTFSIPLTLSVLVTMAGLYLDRFLISGMYGTAKFAIYNNATIVIPSIAVVANAGSAVLMSELSKRTSTGDFDSFIAIWNSAMLKSAIILFAAAGFLVWWAHDTMRLLFSDRFTQSGDIFMIYVLSIPLQILTLSSLYVALGATRQLLIIPIVGLILEVVCIFGFRAVFGFYGIAIGSVIARYLGMIYGSYMFVKKLTNIGWKRFMPWIRLTHVLLIAVIAGVISKGVAFTPIRAWSPIVAYLLGLLVFTSLYIVGLYIARMLHFLVPTRLLPGKLKAAIRR